MIVVASKHLRAQLRGVGLAKQLGQIDQLANPAGATLEYRVTICALRSIAAWIRFLTSQAAELDLELLVLVPKHPTGPRLLAEPAVRPVVAAQLLVSWCHRGRVRNKAAFACLAGVSPLEASSGQRTRHQLSRRRDRNLNAPCTPSRLVASAATRNTENAETRRATRGETHRDVRRSLKRILARRFYRLIQTATLPAAPRIEVAQAG